MATYLIRRNPEYVGSIEMPVLQFSNSNLEELELISQDIVILKLFSEAFKHYFNENSFSVNGKKAYDYNTTFFNRIIDENPDEDFYVVAPISVTSKEDYSQLNANLMKVHSLLTIGYPSKLYVRYKVEFNVEASSLNRSSIIVYPKKNSYAYPRNNFQVSSFDQFITFATKYFSFTQSNYFKVAREMYQNSFEMSYYSMQYLNLIMCLECIVDGPQELSYRLKRGIAIIAGTDKSSCELIYKNINNVYKIRSKLVHGEQTYNEIIHDHIPYLILLCSKFLKEMILLEVKNKQKLNKDLTSIGFGQIAMLSEDYSPLIIDESIENRIRTIELQNNRG